MMKAENALGFFGSVLFVASIIVAFLTQSIVPIVVVVLAIGLLFIWADGGTEALFKPLRSVKTQRKKHNKTKQR